jgi:hypothetical protein
MVADSAEDTGELVPTDVDERTHAELIHLYRESADSIRFAKSQQWKTLGTSLLTFGALIVIRELFSHNLWFMKAMFAVTILLAGASIYTLVIYQVWQNSEREKIARIASRFSSLAQEIRAIKSDRESNVFRYILLVFLIAGVLIGCMIALVAYAPFIQAAG